MGGNSLIDRLFKRESTTKEEIQPPVDEEPGQMRTGSVSAGDDSQYL